MIDIEKIKKNKSIQELLEFSIINIDKPIGPTSFSVSQFVKKSLNSKKTAHFGTLDPGVTGVLPIALNRACRLNEYLMHRNKKYVGIMKLHKDNISDNELNKVIKKFIGKISQLPPKKSRVKRAIREREVISFDIIEREEKDILFETEVQAGTYIRKLCDDIGKEIGGAHMLELRRVKAGLFSEIDEKNPSMNLYDFEKVVNSYKEGKEEELRKILIPGEIIATILPIIKIKKDIVKKVLSGSPIFPQFLEKNQENELKKLNQGEKICVFSDNQFIGCYNFISPDNLVAKPQFVKN